MALLPSISFLLTILILSSLYLHNFKNKVKAQIVKKIAMKYDNILSPAGPFALTSAPGKVMHAANTKNIAFVKVPCIKPKYTRNLQLKDHDQ